MSKYWIALWLTGLFLYSTVVYGQFDLYNKPPSSIDRADKKMSIMIRMSFGQFADNIIPFIGSGGVLNQVHISTNEDMNQTVYMTILNSEAPGNSYALLLPHPNVTTEDDIKKKIEEYRQRHYVPTQICAYMDKDFKKQMYFGRFELIWNNNIDATLAFSETANQTDKLMVGNCGYSGAPNSPIRLYHQNRQGFNTMTSQTGLPLSDCLEYDRRIQLERYFASSFQVYTKDRKPYCNGIWERLPFPVQSQLTIGSNVDKLIAEMQSQNPLLTPKEITAYWNEGINNWTYAILWNNLDRQLPRSQRLWNWNTINVDYMPKMKESWQPADFNTIDFWVRDFLKKYDIPGLSIAISKDDQLKFAAGYGDGAVGGKMNRQPMRYTTPMQLASISKSITSLAILRLMEMNRIYIDQRVFGPGNTIFGDKYGPPSAYTPNMTTITVKNLMEHTGGWLRPPDPQFEPMLYQLDNDQLIEYMLANHPVTGKPDQVFGYSNFNYIILGKAIEKITGKSYVDAVQELVLKPAKVKATIFRGQWENRYPDEPIYYPMLPVLQPYGWTNDQQFYAPGGWQMTPSELLKYLAVVDGITTRPDIIKPETVKLMLTPSRASKYIYAKGWEIKNDEPKGFGHNGMLSGQSSLWKVEKNNVAVAVTINGQAFALDGAMRQLAYQLATDVKDWPKEDFFNGANINGSFGIIVVALLSIFFQRMF